MPKTLLLLLSLSLLTVSHSLTNPSDISALKSFLSSIKPSSIPSYSCLASWNFSSDPCSVPRTTHFICGLTCTPDSLHIQSITLDFAGYSGTLSPLISLLSQLTNLDLSNNFFFGTIPSSLSSLSLLTSLSLRSNSFSGSLPSSLSSLKSLQSLDISYNYLSGYLPNSLVSLSSLRRLDLSFNKFSGSLPKLPNSLIELALKNNFLSGYLSSSSFSGLYAVEVVELSSNSFSGSIQPWFFQLPSLQQVNLYNNSLTHVDIPAGSNSDLVAIDLSFNKIEGNLPSNFYTYPRLSSLSLRYNHLRGPIPLEFSKKESLKRLYLDGNYLNGKPPEGFFSGESSVSGSLGDNCLISCPVSSQLCLPSQKPTSICRQAYGGKPRS
ncbi:Leucine-rich repeat [Dillenia turbinata]|uniref:Leucine-rich repeat n=1 Tax=Dillenia turbinata TaxID=194707 RepID=A0AAN8URZ0_9MAGN